MHLPSSLRILAFGDSLTAGFTQGGAVYHPYTLVLKIQLEKAFPSFNITTDNQGASGDQATSPPGQFLPRMRTCYDKAHMKDPYDWAIILGGTNDLAVRRKPEDFYPYLEETWSIPLRNGTKVLALTVPDNADSSLIKRRAKLNSWILANDTQNLYTYDLHKAMPFWDIPEERWKEIWDDTTHFTANGYDLIGKLLATKLTELIKAEIEETESDNGTGRNELR